MTNEWFYVIAVPGPCESRRYYRFRDYYCFFDVEYQSEMATKRIYSRIDVDESGCAARRGLARQNCPFVTRPAPLPTDEHLDSEEAELTAAGLVHLPEESLPNSFWKMPAPRVSLIDAVSAVASERAED